MGQFICVLMMYTGNCPIMKALIIERSAGINQYINYMTELKKRDDYPKPSLFLFNSDE